MGFLPLSPKARELLRKPETWRFVSTAFPPDVRPARRFGHGDWSARHSHAHANREILLVLSGTGFQMLGGRVYPARPGTAFLFDAMEPHDAGYAPDQGRAEHLWIVFVHDQCTAHLIQMRPGGKQPRRPWSRLLSTLDLGLSSVTPIFPKPVADTPADEAARLRCMAAVRFLVASLLEKMTEPPPSETAQFQEEIIAAIQRHIRENAGRGCRLENLARIAGYSKYHFLRLFHKHAGMPLHLYVDLCREETYRHMTQAGARQKTICAALGFGHASTLTHWRKRRGL